MAPLPVPMPTSIAWKVCDDFDGNNPAILDITDAGMLDLHDARRPVLLSAEASQETFAGKRQDKHG